jgi:hypothetical protein
VVVVDGAIVVDSIGGVVPVGSVVVVEVEVVDDGRVVCTEDVAAVLPLQLAAKRAQMRILVLGFEFISLLHRGN